GRLGRHDAARPAPIRGRDEYGGSGWRTGLLGRYRIRDLGARGRPSGSGNARPGRCGRYLLEPTGAQIQRLQSVLPGEEQTPAESGRDLRRIGGEAGAEGARTE